MNEMSFYFNLSRVSAAQLLFGCCLYHLL